MVIRATPARSGCLAAARRAGADPGRNVYALVRVADEIVDNPDPAPGARAARAMLDRLEDGRPPRAADGLQRQPRRARLRPDRGRLRHRPGPDRPVLRLDADGPHHHRARPRQTFDRYVYGSAEVVGPHVPAGVPRRATDGGPTGDVRPARARRPPPRRRLPEAQLPARPRPRTTTCSAARYFPGLDVGRFCDADRDRLLDDIDADLAAAAAAVPELPREQPRGRPGRARHVRRARRPAPRHPRRRDPPHAGAGARRRSRPGSSPARSTAVGLTPARRAARPAARRERRVASGRRRRRGDRRARHRRPARRRRPRASTCSSSTTPSAGGPAASSGTASASTPAPSWYLMPEVFDHFFALLGTTADEQLDLTVLDPELPGLLRGPPRPGRRPPGPRAQPRAVRDASSRAPARAFDAYLDSADGRLRLALRRFLYTTLRLAVGRSCTPTWCAGPPRLAAAPDPLAGEPRRRAFRRPAAAAGARLPRGVPRLLARPGAEHVPPDEPPRPRRRRPLPAGRVHRAHRGGRRARRSSTAPGCTPAPRSRRSTTRPGVAAAARRGVTAWPTRRPAATERRCPADVVVGAADLHHLETALLPRRAADPPRAGVAPARPRARRGAGDARRARARCPSSRTTRCSSPATGTRNFDAIFGRATRVPDPASIYVCRPRRPTRRSRRRGTRTSSCSCRCPPTPRIGRGGDDGAGVPPSSGPPTRPSTRSPRWAGVPDLRDRVVSGTRSAPRTSHATSTPGAAARWASSTPCARARCSGPATCRAKVDGLLYAGASTVPGVGLPMCLISAELVLKRLRGDRSALPVPVR